MCEVVGFTSEEVFLSPLGEMKGIGPSSEVIPTRLPLSIKVGPQLLGRVLDALGQPFGCRYKRPSRASTKRSRSLEAPPDPLKTKNHL